MTYDKVKQPKLSEDYMVFDDRAYIRLKGEWLLLSEYVTYFDTRYGNRRYYFVLTREDGISHEFDVRELDGTPYLFEEVRYTDWRKQYYEISLQALKDYTADRAGTKMSVQKELEMLDDADKVKLASVNPNAKKVYC